MRGIAPNARIAAGQLEDVLAVWDQRNPNGPERYYRDLSIEAERLCKVISDEFDALRLELRGEREDFDEEVANQKGFGLIGLGTGGADER